MYIHFNMQNVFSKYKFGYVYIVFGIFSFNKMKILILMFDAHKIELNLSFVFVKSQNDFPFLLIKMKIRHNWFFTQSFSSFNIRSFCSYINEFLNVSSETFLITSKIFTLYYIVINATKELIKEIQTLYYISKFEIE